MTASGGFSAFGPPTPELPVRVPADRFEAAPDETQYLPVLAGLEADMQGVARPKAFELGVFESVLRYDALGEKIRDLRVAEYVGFLTRRTIRHTNSSNEILNRMAVEEYRGILSGIGSRAALESIIARSIDPIPETAGTDDEQPTNRLLADVAQMRLSEILGIPSDTASGEDGREDDGQEVGPSFTLLSRVLDGLRGMK